MEVMANEDYLDLKNLTNKVKGDLGVVPEVGLASLKIVSVPRSVRLVLPGAVRQQ